jgi:hypothetical protein
MRRIVSPTPVECMDPFGVPMPAMLKRFCGAACGKVRAAAARCSWTFVIHPSKCVVILITRRPANGKGGSVRSRIFSAEMSDSQLTSLARLSDRLVTLKERL